MIDVGLLASIAIMLLVPTVFVRPWPTAAAVSGLFDVSGGALFFGLFVGRVTALALDDPGSLTSVSDLIIIRSGVEFWPGVAAGLAWMSIGAMRQRVAPTQRLAAIAAPALVAWACYEATCLLRDGCPGPVSSIGLRPDGLVERMIPIGLVVAAAATGAAVVVQHLRRQQMPSSQAVVLALVGIAVIRAVASIWLPRIGSGLTRQHQTSLAVAVVGSLAFVALRGRNVRRAAATP